MKPYQQYKNFRTKVKRLEKKKASLLQQIEEIDAKIAKAVEKFARSTSEECNDEDGIEEIIAGSSR